MKAAIPLPKKVLAPLGITAAASAIDTENQKKQKKNKQKTTTKKTWFCDNNFNNFKQKK